MFENEIKTLEKCRGICVKDGNGKMKSTSLLPQVSWIVPIFGSASSELDLQSPTKWASKQAPLVGTDPSL